MREKKNKYKISATFWLDWRALNDDLKKLTLAMCARLDHEFDFYCI